jgi:hypothetical protein
MFEEYLEDSYSFLVIAEAEYKKTNERVAKRYYRASVFYSAGAIESFLNYIADSFAKAKSLTDQEIAYLNDKRLVFSIDKGSHERTEYHSIDDKLRLLLKKFGSSVDIVGGHWSNFMQFKQFRDSLLHPRQAEDKFNIEEYRTKVKTGLSAIIEIMNQISIGIYKKPLRKKLLDLIP